MAAGVRAGDVPAAGLAADALAGIAALDPALHFVNTLAAEAALRAAAAIDRLPAAERARLPLAGVPFLAKAETTTASPLVRRLAEAGAVLLGTSTRPDPAAVSQAWGWNGQQETGNPWDAGRSSGGSSAGAAAAVAAGVIPLATGGDSDGSLRLPAAFCGVTTLKGTYGRLPRGAGRSLAQLTVAGVIAADLDDVVLATSAASGPHPFDPASLPPWPVPPAPAGAGPGRRLTVGFSPDLGGALPDPAVAGLVAGRLEELAAAGAITLRAAEVHLTDPGTAWLPLAALERGQPVEPAAVLRAHEVRRRNDRALAAVFAEVDVLVTPTTPKTAFPLGEYAANLSAGDLCWGFNLSGHPAVTVPAGLLDGLPAGLQAVAPLHRDDQAVELARLAAVRLPAPPLYWDAAPGQGR